VHLNLNGVGLNFPAPKECPSCASPSTHTLEMQRAADRMGSAVELDPMGQSLERLSAAAFEGGSGYCGMIAQKPSKAVREDFWAVREMMPTQPPDRGRSPATISRCLGRCLRFIHSAGEKVTALGDFRINCFRSKCGRRKPCTIMSSPLQGRQRRESHLGRPGADSRRRSTIWCMNWAALSVAGTRHRAAQGQRPSKRYTIPRSCPALHAHQGRR